MLVFYKPDITQNIGKQQLQEETANMEQLTQNSTCVCFWRDDIE